MSDLTFGGFKTKKFKNKILITTNSGNWDFISTKDYDDLINGDLTSKNGLIVSKNVDYLSNLNSYKEFNYYYKEKASLNIFVLTKRCNLNCIYCHNFIDNSYNSKYDMSIDTAKKFLKFMNSIPSKSLNIEFQGGEPTLNFKTLKFIVNHANDYIKNKNISFELVTNLTNLNDEIVLFLIENNVSITSSLDGPKKINDSQRLSPSSSYEAVRKNYFFLKEYYNLKVGLLMVFTKNSIDYYKAIIEEYIIFNQGSIQLKYLSKLGRANNNWNNISITIDDFLIYLKKSLDYLLLLNKRGFNIKSRYILLVYQKFYAKNPSNYVDFRSPCGMAIGQILYDYDGSIYPCDEARAFSEFKIGNSDMKYNQILTQSKTKKLILSSFNKNYICENCVYQPYCGVCPILNYAETGSLELLDSNNGHCKYFKFLFDYFFENIVSNDENIQIFHSLFNENKIPSDIILKNINNNYEDYIENEKNIELKLKDGSVQIFNKLNYINVFLREAEFLENEFNIEDLMTKLNQKYSPFFKLNENYYEFNNNTQNNLIDYNTYFNFLNNIKSLKLLHQIPKLSYFTSNFDYDGDNTFIYPLNLSKNNNQINLKKPSFIFNVSDRFISDFFDFNNSKEVSHKFKKIISILNDQVYNYDSF